MEQIHSLDGREFDVLVGSTGNWKQRQKPPEPDWKEISMIFPNLASQSNATFKNETKRKIDDVHITVGDPNAVVEPTDCSLTSGQHLKEPLNVIHNFVPYQVTK